MRPFLAKDCKDFSAFFKSCQEEVSYQNLPELEEKEKPKKRKKTKKDASKQKE